jgi:hypothetical protein
MAEAKHSIIDLWHRVCQILLTRFNKDYGLFDQVQSQSKARHSELFLEKLRH